MTNIYSTNRQTTLSGWLKKYQPDEFNSHLKLQKFLFFYETMCKVGGDEYDYTSLKGYEKGPVFANVYADYEYRKQAFSTISEESYEMQSSIVDERKAKSVGFLVKVLTESELSDLTHNFHIWKNKENEIERKRYQIQLNENDLDGHDFELINTLKSMYPPSYVDSVEVLRKNDKSFVISKDDHMRLTSDHINVLDELSQKDYLINPVYLEMDEEGVLLVD